MNIKITIDQLKHIIVEQTEQEYMFYEILDEKTLEVFYSFKNKEKIKFRLINPTQYKKALEEFIKYGQLMRFPEKIIYKWKHMVINNVALLSVLTDINGHSENFPFREFNDTFDSAEPPYETNQLNLFTGEKDWVNPEGEYSVWLKQKFEETKNKDYLKKQDWDNCIEFLDEVYNFEEYEPRFSNGQPVLSDYGLDPLFKLINIIIHQEKPEEILVTINKILDVAHQRSDLSELFLVGGQASHWSISNI
jgi:hypothetical protein